MSTKKNTTRAATTKAPTAETIAPPTETTTPTDTEVATQTSETTTVTNAPPINVDEPSPDTSADPDAQSEPEGDVTQESITETPTEPPVEPIAPKPTPEVSVVEPPAEVIGGAAATVVQSAESPRFGTASVVVRALVAQYKEYAETMAAGRAVNAAPQQTRFLRAVESAIALADGKDFGFAMESLLETVRANRHSAFDEKRAFRGIANMAVSKSDLLKFEILMNLLLVVSMGRNDPKALAVIDLETQLAVIVDEAQRQRLSSFIRAWCGVS